MSNWGYGCFEDGPRHMRHSHRLNEKGCRRCEAVLLQRTSRSMAAYWYELTASIPTAHQPRERGRAAVA